MEYTTGFNEKKYFESAAGLKLTIDAQNEDAKNIYKFIFPKELKHLNLENILFKEAFGKKTLTRLTYETDNATEAKRIVNYAQTCNLISKEEKLQLKQMLLNFNEQHPIKAKNIEDIDADMADEIEALFAKNICEQPLNSPFADTDLVIFKDEYSGKMPLNGIRESDFKKVCRVYKNICNHNSYIAYALENDKPFLAAIKHLLTREIGRKLIYSCALNHNNAIKIKQGHENIYYPSNKTINIDSSVVIFEVEARPNGLNRLRKLSTPFYIILAHEMVHHLHNVHNNQAFKERSKVRVPDYDNKEEEITITGFSVELASDAVFTDSEDQAATYDEFNERLIQAAFTDTQNLFYPRFGHGGMVNKKNLDDLNPNDYFYYFSLEQTLNEISKSNAPLDLMELVIKEKLKLQAEPEEAQINQHKRREVIRAYDKQILAASQDVNHAWYQQLNGAFAQPALLTLEKLRAKTLNLLHVEESACAIVRQDGLMLQYAPEAVRGNIEIAKAAIKQNPMALEYISEDLKSNIELIKMAVKLNPMALEFASDSFKNNIELVETAVKQNPMALMYAGPKPKNDIAIIKASIQQWPQALKYAGHLLDTEIEIVKAAVQKEPLLLEYASAALKNNKDVVQAAVKQCSAAFQYASEDLKKDMEFVKLLVQHNGDVLEFASKEAKNNIEIVKMAVQNDGNLLQFAGEKPKNNKDIVRIAVAKSKLAMQYAAKELKNDETFVRELISQQGLLLSYVDERFRRHIDIVEAAVTQNGHALKYVHPELKQHLGIVKRAVRQSGEALKFADEELRHNREIVTVAIKQNGEALQYASAELANNFEIVMTAVQQSGLALQYASEELKNNFEIVEAAFTQSDYAFEYASYELRNNNAVVKAAVQASWYAIIYAGDDARNDFEVIKAAVQQSGLALEYASAELQNDIEMVNMAVHQNGMALKFASAELRNHVDVVRTAVQQNPKALKYASKTIRKNNHLLGPG